MQEVELFRLSNRDHMSPVIIIKNGKIKLMLTHKQLFYSIMLRLHTVKDIVDISLSQASVSHSVEQNIFCLHLIKNKQYFNAVRMKPPAALYTF